MTISMMIRLLFIMLLISIITSLIIISRSSRIIISMAIIISTYLFALRLTLPCTSSVQT